MSIKTELLEDYVKFVDTATIQNKYFKLIVYFLLLLCLGLSFFFSLKNLTEKHFFNK